MGDLIVNTYPGQITEPCDSTIIGCEPVCGSEPSSAKQGGPGLSYTESYESHAIVSTRRDHRRHDHDHPEVSKAVERSEE